MSARSRRLFAPPDETYEVQTHEHGWCTLHILHACLLLFVCSSHSLLLFEFSLRCVIILFSFSLRILRNTFRQVSKELDVQAGRDGSYHPCRGECEPRRGQKSNHRKKIIVIFFLSFFENVSSRDEATLKRVRKGNSYPNAE